MDSPTPPQPTYNLNVCDQNQVFQWFNDLSSTEDRENALTKLSEYRELIPYLAQMLWHSHGIMSILMHEIANVYPLLNPPTLTVHQSNKVCKVLALVQCVASHPDTRLAFLSSNFARYLHPFLQTHSAAGHYECLRLASLGVFSAMIKTNDHLVISYLLQTELIDHCLGTMVTGDELSKTTAAFILQKLLLDVNGVSRLCSTYGQFSRVAKILEKIVISLTKEPSPRLLKQIILLYLRLCKVPRVRQVLQEHLPEPLKDYSFAQILNKDMPTLNCLIELHRELGGRYLNIDW